MPIHDQGYRRYEDDGSRRAAAGGSSRAPGSWSGCASGASSRCSSSRGRPFIVRAVQIYVASNFAQAAFLAPTPETFREFLDQQSIFVFFVTIYVGAGLIANDRRANALQIYLSKPLTRVEYITGKLVTLLVFLVGVTFAPAILLLLLQMMFAGSTAFIRANLFLFPAITLFSLIQVLLSAFAMLALSSLSKSRRFVAMMYAGIIFFTAAMYQALQRDHRQPRLGVDLARRTRSTSSRMPSSACRIRAAMPIPVALLAIVVLIAGSIWILERRVRGVEVVT